MVGIFSRGQHLFEQVHILLYDLHVVDMKETHIACNSFLGVVVEESGDGLVGALKMMKDGSKSSSQDSVGECFRITSENLILILARL